MCLKTAAEIAKLKGVSRQAANDFILKNNVAPSGKKGKYPTYDIAKEPLKSYLAKRQKPPPVPDEQPDTAQPSRNTEAAVRRVSKPLNDLLAGKMPDGVRPAAYFYSEAYKIAVQNQDAGLLAKLAQVAHKEDADEAVHLQMIKTEQAKEQIAQERAERLKIENKIRLEQYLEKSVVKVLFGRVYAVHTSVLTSMPLKLSDTINALPPSPDRRAKIHKLIDDEIYSALEMIKRILVEYVEIDDEPA